MDPEDRQRIAKHLENLLRELQRTRVLTNTEVRAIAGTRGMARVFDLKKAGHPITTRKLTGGLWEVRYGQPALGRSAETPAAPPGFLFDLHRSGYQA